MQRQIDEAHAHPLRATLTAAAAERRYLLDLLYTTAYGWVMLSLKQPMVPVSKVAVSWTRSVHVPALGSPNRFPSGCSGLNTPANGAVPEAIGVAAESLKVVGVLAPEQSFVPLP